MLVVQDALRKHARPLLEVAFTFAFIVFILWMPRPQQGWLSLIALGWILGSSFLVRENRDAVELGISGFRRSLWVIATALVLASIEILIAQHEQTLHSPFVNGVVRYRFSGYVIWSFVQQFILQDYFLLRFLRAFRKPSWAVVTSATLFALAHLPNPVLTVATLLWGVVACTLFLRYRDIYSLGVVHAVFGLTIAVCVPAAIHHNMRVGLGYLRYHPHHAKVQRSQIDQSVSTDAWVMADAAIRRSERQARP
jgi:membrane protease YdiL (CAAX protease family)